MTIKRSLEKILKNKDPKGKAFVILGARQVGKTTLLKKIERNSDKKTLFLNCDLFEIRALLNKPTLSSLKRLIGAHQIIFIDEAQRIENIGIILKIIIDEIKPEYLFISGSSALEINDKINEPLTGRKFEHQIFPLSIQELHDHFGFLEIHNNLENFILYGMYPDVINNRGNEIEILQNLVSSYLFKDVLSDRDMRKPELIERLIEALALQVGSEVNFGELSRLLGAGIPTIQKYVHLLEKSFIIFRLRSYSRNARNELKKSRKIYFYDNGIRNAILGNFTTINKRNDAGALWENFVISERMKYNHYQNNLVTSYFWRTTQQQEIDYLEEINGELTAFEIKWNTAKKVRFSKTFLSNYPNARTQIINPESVWDFLGI